VPKLMKTYDLVVQSSEIQSSDQIPEKAVKGGKAQNIFKLFFSRLPTSLIFHNMYMKKNDFILCVSVL
jgi:hypothetical protein